jgi:hypothetical protein
MTKSTQIVRIEREVFVRQLLARPSGERWKVDAERLTVRNYDYRVDTDGLLRLPTGKIIEAKKGRINWNQEFDVQTNTNTLWFYSLAWIFPQVKKYDKDGDVASLELVVDFVTQFLQAVGDRSLRRTIYRNRDCGSVDHAFAYRARLFMVLLQSMIRQQHDDKFPTLIQSLARTIWIHAEWLARDASRSTTNHGVMVDLTLLETGLSLSSSNAYVEVAVGRLVKFARRAFNIGGFCRENSTAYHIFNLRLYEKALAIMAASRHEAAAASKAEVELRNTCATARAVLCRIVQPYGGVPAIGDGHCPHIVERSTEGVWTDGVQIAIAKSAGLYVSAFCGRSAAAHKHVDDTSLTLQFAGRDVLIDGGSYNYDRSDPVRRALESSAGHSSLSVSMMDGMLAAKWGGLISSASLKQAIETTDGFQLEMGFAVADWFLAANRQVCGTWDGRLTIADTVERTVDDGAPLESMLQRFLLAPALGLIRREDEAFSVLLVFSDGLLEVAMSIDAPADAVAVFNGHADGISAERLGWVSPSPNKICPTNQVVIRRPLKEHRTQGKVVVRLRWCEQLAS